MEIQAQVTTPYHLAATGAVPALATAPQATIPCQAPDLLCQWGELLWARGMDLLGCIRGLICVVVGSREALDV